jgi:acyl-CoA synthetase (AMP-forming)/AMP-acid ligase II
LKDGALFISGRHKDMMIVAGRNHYPQDIERTVEGSGAAIRPGGCAAFAVDVGGQEHLVVVAEIQRGYQAPSDDTGDASCRQKKNRTPLDAGAVMAAIRHAIAQEHDLSVHVVSLVRGGSIPRTSSGKVQRHACRTIFVAGALDPLAEWTTGRHAFGTRRQTAPESEPA